MSPRPYGTLPKERLRPSDDASLSIDLNPPYHHEGPRKEMSRATLNSLSALVTAAAFLVSTGASAEESAEPVPAEASAEPAGGADTPATTSAAPVETTQQPTSKMNLVVAPPDKALERTEYAHNGFYFRMNAGAGFLYTSANNKAVGLSDDGYSFALGLDALIGGTVAPGMAFGFAALTNTAIGVPLFDRSITQFHFLAGPFFDAYPNNKKGGHIGASLGFAGTNLDNIGGGAAFGGGGALWFGYDAWVAPDWGVGFLIRGTGAYMGGSDVESSSLGVQGMVTILRN